MNGYFDNGATSWPKPPECAEQIARYLNETGGPYGRSFYPRALEVSRTVEETRDLLAPVLGTGDSGCIVFTQNATMAINTVLRGLGLERGDIVYSSALEHNALTRPLKRLEDEQGICVRLLPSLPDGALDLERTAGIDFSGVSLVAVNHMSNVNGLVQPLKELRALTGNVPLLLDAAQSAGHIPLEADAWGVDYLAFTGHKALLGPPGTGGLFVRDVDTLTPLMAGGTGSRSESYDTPSFMPDKFEAGTPNIAGIFGLYGSLTADIEPRHLREDFLELLRGVSGLPGYRVYRAEREALQGELFSLTHERMDSSELAMRLYETHRIETRPGLHCAPLAHRTLGTFPEGTVRIAPSLYHSARDFEMLLEALEAAGEKSPV
jgi:cysteine desulfurase family protein